MEFHEIRQEEFSSVKGIYLNHAGVSPLPNRTSRAVQDAAGLLSSDPIEFFMTQGLPALKSCRSKLANLLGVAADHMAFTRNTGHGLSIVADSLKLEPGDNVVCVGADYPAVVYPWTAQRWRGVEVRLIETQADGSFTADDLAAAADEKTKAVAVSWVQFATGFRANIPAIVEMSHSRGAICIVDVIQGLGAIRYDNAECGADVVATGSHKWLLSPSGVGGLYVAPEVLERMNLVNIAALSTENFMSFDSRKFDPVKTIQRVEEGSYNLLGVVGVDSSISLIEEIGIDRIEDRVLKLSLKAATLLEARGYTVTSSRKDGELSGIVMFSSPEHSNQVLLDGLKAATVVAAERGGKIRFAPHFYNSLEEIERAVDALPQL